MVARVGRSVLALTLCVAGFMVGQAYAWWQFEREFPATNRAENSAKNSAIFPMRDLLKTQGVMITNDHFSCEGLKDHTVGAVLGSFLIFNNNGHKNRVSFGCDPHHEGNDDKGPRICTISFDGCRPWQFNECGSRILEFKLNTDGSINTQTFICMDTP